jgi:hypothetical protein
MAVLTSTPAANAEPCGPADQLCAWSSCLGVDTALGWQTAVRATRSRGQIRFHPVSDTTCSTRIPVAAALPVHTSFLRRLRAPFASPRKAEKVWPSLLDIQLPFPLDTAVYQFLAPTRTSDGQVEALAVAARREDLDAWRTSLLKFGHEPWLVDHEGLALWSRSVAEQPLEKQGFRLVCYVGQDRLALAWGRGPELLAASGLRLGARELFGPERGEAARRQFAQRAGPFLRAQPQPDKQAFQWAWCGPGAVQADQIKQLESALDLSNQATYFIHREAESFLARAVAARALHKEPTRCSLLPAQLAPTGYQQVLSSRARRPPLALAAVALLLIGINLGWSAWLNQRRDHLQQAVQTQSAELAGTDQLPRGQEVLTAERALKERDPAYLPFRAALDSSLLALLKDVLHETASRGMTLETLNLNGKTLAGQGTAADWAHGEALAAHLTRQGWLIELQRQDAAADERVHFALKASR